MNHKSFFPNWIDKIWKNIYFVGGTIECDKISIAFCIHNKMHIFTTVQHTAHRTCLHFNCVLWSRVLSNVNELCTVHCTWYLLQIVSFFNLSWLATLQMHVLFEWMKKNVVDIIQIITRQIKSNVSADSLKFISNFRQNIFFLVTQSDN